MDGPLTFNKKKQAKTGKYSIITVDLHKPKGNKYPHFDFNEVKKKLGQGSDNEDDERFIDQDAREIVRRLNERHPNKKTKSGRKIRYNEDDFIEKSLGYDLEDTWIDDSEAHDELVPSTLDTKKGGFYVNKGVLDFVSIGEEDSDEESEEEEERPKKKKKEVEKPAVRAPKRPDQIKADEAKKTADNIPKKRAAIPSSSSDSEESEKEERRRVGGPPTLKKSKPSGAAPSSAAASPAAAKKPEERKEEKAAEPRRMTGAPPNLARKKPDPALRPSLAGKPPLSASPVKQSQPIVIETISSSSDCEDDQRQDQPTASGSGPEPCADLDMKEVPMPVQQKIIQFHMLCEEHTKSGKKHVPNSIVEKAIEIQSLATRLGTKKSVKGAIMEKLAGMCGYTKAGLDSRIKNDLSTRASTSTAPSVSLASTVSTAASIATTVASTQPQKAAPSSSIESVTSSTSSVKSAVAGPSKPLSSSVIGVKPTPVAAAASTVAAALAAASVPWGEALKSLDPDLAVGKWTVGQHKEVSTKYPTLTKEVLLECSEKMTYEEFCAMAANQIATNQAATCTAAAAAPAPAPPAPPTFEDAKRNWRTVMAKADKAAYDQLGKVFELDAIKTIFSNFKKHIMGAWPHLGEKAFLLMSCTEPPYITEYWKLFIEFGMSTLKDKPLHFLAYLDDIVKRYCGAYGRTDRIIRHFVKVDKYTPVMNSIRMLPDFQKMLQQNNQKETMLNKEAHQLPATLKTSTTNGKSTSEPSGSKPVLKQSQATQPSISQPQQPLQPLTAQQEQFVSLVGGGNLSAQEKMKFWATLNTPSNGTATQSLANLPMQTYLMALQQTHEANTKKAKEDEARRLLMAKTMAEEAEKKRKEKAEEMEKRRKEKEEEMEKRRKEKEEAAALKKAQKEEEKRLEKEKKQREAEEERRRKEEEKMKKMEEERQRRLREEEEKERRRKEEMERKLREEAEKRRLEEELARQRETLRIKQEEERRQLVEKERQERLREEEEQAALRLAEEVTMEMEEMEGIPRPLTETEEVEVAEEEERKKERERQVIAAREAAMQRQQSMTMSSGLGCVKQEKNASQDKELLDSFFMGGSAHSSQSSSAATVCGPVSSREGRETAPTTASACSSNATISNSYNDQMMPMSAMGMMMPSPMVPGGRFQNGTQYQQPSNPPTPYGHVSGSPYASHSSPHQNASPMASHSSPMMNPSPSQLMAVAKTEGGGSGAGTPVSIPRQNSFSSPANSMGLGSPQMQQGQHMQQLQQQSFFPNQPMQPTNGMQHQQQPVLPHAQPSMQQRQQPYLGNTQQPVQQQQGSQMQQMQPNMGNMSWQQPMQQQQPPSALPTPLPTPPHLQQHSMMGQQRTFAQGMKMPQGQPMMGGGGGGTNQMGQTFPNQQSHQAPPQLQQPQQQFQSVQQQQQQQPQQQHQMNDQMRQMALFAQQQNAQISQQRTQQNQQNSNMNRYF